MNRQRIARIFRKQRHRDVANIRYSAGDLDLIERIAADSKRKGGDYLYVSEPHTMRNCPFRERDRIPFADAGPNV